MAFVSGIFLFVMAVFALLMGIMFFSVLFGLIFIVAGVYRWYQDRQHDVKRMYPKVFVILGIVILLAPYIYGDILVNVFEKWTERNGYYTESQENSVYAGLNCEGVYEKTVNDFFKYCAEKDEDAIYNMFSVSVQKKNPNLREQIQQFLATYPVHFDRNEGRNAVESSYTEDDTYMGISKCNGELVITKDNNNYYVLFQVVYENYENPEKIGLKKIGIFSEKAYCQNPEPAFYGQNILIRLQCSGDYETRRIGGEPYIFTPVERSMHVEEVKTFLKTRPTISEFKEKYGVPNASYDDDLLFYELEEENGEERYLVIDRLGDDVIFDATVIGKEDGYTQVIYKDCWNN